MKMNLKQLAYVAAAGAALCLAQGAYATDYHWTGLGNDGLWNNPANWDNGVPVGPGNGAFLDAANGWSTITITNTDDIVVPDMVFGPEWGVTLNIYGKVHCGWYTVPVQWDSAGTRSVINMYDDSVYTAEGLAIGDTWWWSGGPYVTMNMHSNSFAGINWMFWGGRINLYDNTVLSITNGLTVATADAVSDATRFINLEGHGTLVLPMGFTSTVTNWIGRGILLVYNTPGDAPDIVIDEANATWPGRTVVYTTATNANPMLAIRIEVPRTNLYVGGLEQARVYADYGNATNVDVTSLSGMGVNYQSTATGVATISASGAVRAVGVGTATLNVNYFGTLSNSVSVTVATYTNTASLVHRYSFSESGGATTVDSVGGADGALSGGAVLAGGEITLDGSSGYVQLPPGVVSNMEAITIEAWANFGAPAGYATLYAFGDQNAAATPLGRNYIMFSPFTGALAPTANMTFGMGDPGYLNEQDATLPLVANGVTNYLGNVYLACVYHPMAGYVALYTNGTLAVINNNVSNPLDTTLGTDPINYLGLSLYASDPYLAGSISEFRIYKGALPAAQIAAHNALGTEQVAIGANTVVSMAAADAGGGSVALSWSTNSALVTVLASPTLGAGATWTQVVAGYTLVNGNYQLVVPASSSTRFFRLQN
jgi:hypothetical protein